MTNGDESDNAQPRWSLASMTSDGSSRWSRCVGFIAEWHLVVAKAVRHRTFGLASWFAEKAVMFEPPLAEAGFKPVGAIGNPMRCDGGEDLPVELKPKCGGLVTGQRDQ